MSHSKILAFGASNSTTSINQRLALHAGDVLQRIAEVEVTTLDLNDYEMPIFSVEREADSGIPQQAHDFHARLGAVDGIIVSFAEHNGAYTAAYKNVLDWTSRIDGAFFQDRPVLVMATSTGGRGGKDVLAAAMARLPFFGAKITSTFNFGPFADHFGKDGLTTPDLQAELAKAVDAFHAALP